MKCSFIALFLVLLLAGTLHTSLSTALKPSGRLLAKKKAPPPPSRFPADICKLDNAYTRRLHGAGIRFHTEPRFGHRMCGSEFVLHGTCCDYGDLLRNRKRELDQIFRVYHKARGYIWALVDAVKQYAASFSVYINTNTRRKFRYQHYKQRSIRKLTDKEKIDLRDRFLPEITKISNWLNKYRGKVMDDQGHCIFKFMAERATSNCYTCSGRARDFFTQDQLHLHENTCRKIIGQCSSAWLSLIEFLITMNKFNNIIMDIEKHNEVSLIGEDGKNPIREINTWAEQADIKQQLTDCKDGMCKFSLAKSICDEFISIEKPLYLVSILKIMNNMVDQSKIDRAKLTSQTSRSKTANQQSPSSTGRSLSISGLRGRAATNGQASKTTADRTISTPNAVSATLVASASPVAPDASVASVPTQSKLSSSVLLCQGEKTCVSDISVMTVSQCGSIHLACTDPDLIMKGAVKIIRAANGVFNIDNLAKAVKTGAETTKGEVKGVQGSENQQSFAQPAQPAQPAQSGNEPVSTPSSPAQPQSTSVSANKAAINQVAQPAATAAPATTTTKPAESGSSGVFSAIGKFFSGIF